MPSRSRDARQGLSATGDRVARRRVLRGPAGRRADAVASVKHRASSGGLVYSTDAGRMCPTCRRPIAACACGQAVVPVGDGIVRVSRETKGRAGKGVTLVRGLALDGVALVALAKQLKAACGSGGTAKDGAIEIQGDHCERIIDWLRREGHTVKRAGG